MPPIRHAPPKKARRANQRSTSSVTGAKRTVPGVILPVREPYDWDLVLDWLGTRAIPGLEAVEDGVYRRGATVVARAGGGSR